MKELLFDLMRIRDVSLEVILTLNIAGEEFKLDDFSDLQITLIRNQTPKGFGENHNQAYARSNGKYFAVVNPDVRLFDFRIQPLMDVLSTPFAGVCAPLVLSEFGQVEDNARKFPTFLRLTRRLLFKARTLEYEIHTRPLRVDWIAGMFMLFNRQAFQAVRGFDERFFLYMEDADICRRLWGSGFSVHLQPATVVLHKARRDSRRKAKYFFWHVKSALRFLCRF